MSSSAEQTLVTACYVLHLVGAILAVPSLVGLVLNYLKAGDSGALLGSHHRWMIRSFWWATLWLILGYVTVLFAVGWLILGLTWLWYVYRHIRGLISLANGEPMPA